MTLSEAAGPAWFRNALACAPERGTVQVDGATIETLSWGDPAKPGLFLLHGGAAHADWWSFIAPMFVDRYRVVAFSWSGMGRSDWRESYSIRGFAREACIVAREAGLLDGPTPPIWMAHSFGGHPSLVAAVETPEALSALILIDTGGFPAPGVVENFVYSTRASPVFATREQALARFRFVPPDRDAPAFIRDFIAERSITEQGGDHPGWRWRFDFSMWSRIDREPDMLDLLATADIPLAFILGSETQIMADDAADRIRETRGRPTPIAIVPDAGHHIMIDHPLAFVAAVNGLLAAWP
jgi:pimeloyl-ACP methyl ester carboxylesterase